MKFENGWIIPLPSFTMKVDGQHFNILSFELFGLYSATFFWEGIQQHLNQKEKNKIYFMITTNFTLIFTTILCGRL